MTEQLVYYRFEDYLESSGVRVRVVTFDVVKKTPKGAWVRHPSTLDGSMRSYLILDHWHKKFANPTLEGARQDFLARKRRLIAIQERRIRDARLAIATAEKNEFETRLPGFYQGVLKRVWFWEVELCR